MLRLLPGMTRCVFLAWIVTVINLILVWAYFSWHSTASPERLTAAQDRLLLSVEYPATAEERDPDPPPVHPPHLLPLDTSVGMLDKSRKFESHMFYVQGESWRELSENRLACLGTQTSLDRLDQLVELSSTWLGPLSISVFTPDIESSLSLEYIHYLHRCHPHLTARTTFHLSYPVEKPPTEGIGLQVESQTTDCRDPSTVLQSLLQLRSDEFMDWRRSYPYPQNLLRNLAKAGCQTNYTYIPDIDMVLPVGLYGDLERFLHTQQETQPGEKEAFVIPTYEISSAVSRLPQNKTELMDLVGKKQARQFHQAVYSINQKSSNLKLWETLPQEKQLTTAYRVENYIFKYEPLYIARADTPQFDERFVGFGMTRNTQVYEMYVAGYTFILLNNAFTMHRGFQTVSTRPDWRARQQEQNNARFDEFAREVSAHYSSDPYNMMNKLKKMNLKHLKVAYGKSNKTRTSNSKSSL